MDILVKVSGDLEDQDCFYDWLASISKPRNRLFILCGGGTLITSVLERYGIPYEFGPAGREIKSVKGRLLARFVLEGLKFMIDNKLHERRIKATVFAPFREIGDAVYHMNGDNYALALYPNFDKIYIATIRGRTKTFPDNLKKIEVVYL